MATDTTQSQDFHNDASVWQNLSGAAATQNPYLPYLTPKVIERADGTRVLRIPKNQQLMTLAKFFETTGQNQFRTANDFAKSYLSFLKGGTGGRDDQRLALDQFKAFKAKAPSSSVTKIGPTKKSTNSVGGLTFTQKQKDGSYRPITASEYAAANGLDVLDLLKASKDPGDQQVIDKTNELQAEVDAGTMTIEEALQALRTDYPHIYGSSQ